VSDAPAWLRAILSAERTVAAPLNRIANSDEAATVLLLVARAGRHGRGIAERGRATVVHALNLPSHRDVQRLDAKVEHLRRAVEERAAQAHDDSPPS
jgi:hypothetical protein